MLITKTIGNTSNSNMEDDKLTALLESYHEFCLALIKKIPVENIFDDTLMQKAFKFRDDLETAILGLQIKSKEGGINYYAEQIEKLKNEIGKKGFSNNNPHKDR